MNPTDSEKLVRERLAALGESMEVDAAPVPDIMSRGRRGSRRRVVAAVLVPALAVAATVLVVHQVTSPAERRDPTGPATEDVIVSPCGPAESAVNLPDGAVSARLCPSVLRPEGLPTAVLTEDLGRLLAVAQDVLGAPAERGPNCPDVLNPSYDLQFTFPDATTRSVRLSPLQNGSVGCDRVSFGTDQRMTGAQRIIDLLRAMYAEQHGVDVPDTMTTKQQPGADGSHADSVDFWTKTVVVEGRGNLDFDVLMNNLEVRRPDLVVEFGASMPGGPGRSWVIATADAEEDLTAELGQLRYDTEVRLGAPAGIDDVELAVSAAMAELRSTGVARPQSSGYDYGALHAIVEYTVADGTSAAELTAALDAAVAAVQEVRGEAYRPGEVQFVHRPGSGGRRGMVGEGDNGP